MNMIKTTIAALTIAASSFAVAQDSQGCRDTADGARTMAQFRDAGTEASWIIGNINRNIESLSEGQVDYLLGLVNMVYNVGPTVSPEDMFTTVYLSCMGTFTKGE